MPHAEVILPTLESKPCSHPGCLEHASYALVERGAIQKMMCPMHVPNLDRGNGFMSPPVEWRRLPKRYVRESAAVAIWKGFQK
jgi:hypothetical protein